MPEIKRKVIFEIGDIVYLDADPDQYERMVVAYYCGFGVVNYFLRAGEEEETLHSSIEISKNKRDKVI